MRVATGITLVVVGLALLANSYFSLRYLWADYRDSPLAVYLALAGVQIALGSAALVGAFQLLRR